MKAIRAGGGMLTAKRLLDETTTCASTLRWWRPSVSKSRTERRMTASLVAAKSGSTLYLDGWIESRSALLIASVSGGYGFVGAAARPWPDPAIMKKRVGDEVVRLGGVCPLVWPAL